MEYTLPDLIDIERLKAFLEGFHGAAGVAAGISDRAGKIVVSSPMDPFCGDFHRKNERTVQRCVKSDTVLTSEHISESECRVFPCLNGMNHAVSAIRIAGRHIANIYCGQFLIASPDIEFFRAQAARYGFDELRYLDALKQVPVVGPERLPKLLSFLASTAAMLGEMGMERLKLREAERSLKKTTDLYSIITEFTSDAVWTMDMNLRTTWATPSVVRNRGYSVEELAAMPIEEHLTPASLSRVMEIIAAEMTPENLANGNRDLLVRGEFEYTCKDGSTLWSDTVVKLQRDEAGNPIRFLCSSHDITGWKRTEAALRESEEKHRLVAENVSDIIWTADMNLNFTYISPSVTRIRGYSVQEAMAQKLTDRLTPASLKKALETIASKPTAAGKPGAAGRKTDHRTGDVPQGRLNRLDGERDQLPVRQGTGNRSESSA